MEIIEPKLHPATTAESMEVQAGFAMLRDGGNFKTTAYIDNWIWENVPSAYGVYVSGSGQKGFGLELGGTIFEYQLIYNWRSGELSLLYAGGGNVYLGSPTKASYDFEIGSSWVYGASNNSPLAGTDYYVGMTAQLDSFSTVGTTLTKSRSVDVNNDPLHPEWYSDPVSGMPIDNYQIGINIGANLIPNAVDVGGVLGFTSSYEIYTWQIIIP